MQLSHLRSSHLTLVTSTALFFSLQYARACTHTHIMTNARACAPFYGWICMQAVGSLFATQANLENQLNETEDALAG